MKRPITLAMLISLAGVPTAQAGIVDLCARFLGVPAAPPRPRLEELIDNATACKHKIRSGRIGCVKNMRADLVEALELAGGDRQSIDELDRLVYFLSGVDRNCDALFDKIDDLRAALRRIPQ